MRCEMHIEKYPLNPVTPQLVTHGFSTINALNTGAGIWRPTTRVRRSLDVTHWSSIDHAVGQSAAVGDTVGAKSDYNE